MNPLKDFQQTYCNTICLKRKSEEVEDGLTETQREGRGGGGGGGGSVCRDV